MGKRFGRNQRRAAREAVAAAERKASYWATEVAHQADILNRRHKREMEQAESRRRADVAHARRGPQPDMIRLDLRLFADEISRSVQVRAEVDFLRRTPPITAAYGFDREHMLSEVTRGERSVFLDAASYQIAARLYELIAAMERRR